MNNGRAFIGSIMIILSAPLQAENLIFSCQTESGKLVRFSDLDRYVRYSYGPSGFPDLVFIEPKRSAQKLCRNDPNGGFFYHGISLQHDGLTYTVGEKEMVDPSRNYMTVSLEYTLSVTRADGRVLSNIRCSRGIVDKIRAANVHDAMIGDC